MPTSLAFCSFSLKNSNFCLIATLLQLYLRDNENIFQLIAQFAEQGIIIFSGLYDELCIKRMTDNLLDPLFLNLLVCSFPDPPDFLPFLFDFRLDEVFIGWRKYGEEDTFILDEGLEI